MNENPNNEYPTNNIQDMNEQNIRENVLNNQFVNNINLNQQNQVNQVNNNDQLINQSAVNNVQQSINPEQINVQPTILETNSNSPLNTPVLPADDRKLKTASQMIWVFVGNYLVYGFLAYILGEIIKEIKLPDLLSIIISIGIIILVYYFTIKNMFKKNILYKGELPALKKKIITLVIIFGTISFVLEYLPSILFGGFGFVMKMGLGSAIIISIAISVASYFIIPLVAYPLLLNKLGEESETVKSQ